MKIMKKLLADLLVLSMMLGCIGTLPTMAAETAHTIKLTSTLNADGTYSHTAVYDGTAVTEYDYTWHADPSTVHTDVSNSPAEYFTGTQPGNEAVYIAHDIYYYPELPTSGFTKMNYDGEQEWVYYYTASEYSGYIFSTLPGRSTLPTQMMHSAEDAYQNAVLHITQPGDYIIEGDWHGQIWVDLENYCDDPFTDPTAKVNLILNGVTVNCTVAAGVVFHNVYECDNTWEDKSSWSYNVDTSAAGAMVTLADGTENNVTGCNIFRILKTQYKSGSTSVQKKRLKIDGAFYSYQSLVICGQSKGTGTLNITSGYEGLNSELHLTVSGGNVNIFSQDDGINVNEDGVSVLTIKGGSLHILAGLGSEGDGIDSNGFISVNGGTVITMANPGSDSGMDSDFGTYVFGGNVIAMGSTMDWVENDSSVSYDQATMNLQFSSSKSAGDAVVVVDSTGKGVFAYDPDKDEINGSQVRTYTGAVISCENFEIGQSYRVYIGGEITGTETMGVYDMSTVTAVSGTYQQSYGSTGSSGGSNRPGSSGGSSSTGTNTSFALANNVTKFSGVGNYGSSTSITVTPTEGSGETCEHIYSAETTKEATCTTAGVVTYTCSLCGDSYTVTIGATGHSYENGSCTVCGAADPDYVPDYYLVGYINGANYGCEEDYENLGEYKFVDGQLTATFASDSYVFLKTGDNANWYMANAYCTDTQCTFYNTSTGASEKLFVPGNMEITFNLTENDDGSLTLSYDANCAHQYEATLLQDATCSAYATYEKTCALCGSSYTVTADALAERYLEAVPTGMAAEDFDSVTVYRSRDYITGSESWESTGSGSVSYVSGWPTGFDTTNSLYTEYNKADQKVSAYTTATEKLVIDSDQVTGYLYYHWCRSGYPYTSATRSFRYNRFHAYYSTVAPSEADKNDPSDNSYRFDDSTACTDSQWYFYTEVYTQTYTTYALNSTEGGWTDWSDWSTAADTSTDTHQVETRTVYRYNAAALADHSYRSAVTVAATCTAAGVKTYTCSNCGDSYTESIPATGHSYVSGSCSVCGASDPGYVAPKGYYLFGYINGANYACEEDYANLGQYRFENGKLTVTFTQDSYVAVKTEDNGSWYMTNGWQGTEVTSATLYNTNTISTADKLFVPGNVEVTFTLTENGDDTLTLSYTTASTEPSTAPTVGLKYPSLSFEDVIVMNVYYAASDLQDVVEMGLITYSYKASPYGVDTAEHVIPGYTWSDSDQLYYSTTTGIAPKDIGDTIYFAVYYKLADGTYGYTSLVGYSPKTYAYNQLNSGTAEMKPLVVAMLNYGAAAQTYFNYKTDSLMNATLTAAQTALVKTYSDTMIAAVTQASGSKLGEFVNDSTYTKRYPTISFEGAFCINYYFQPSLAVQGDVTMYIWSLEDYEAADALTRDNATRAVTMTRTETGEYLGVVDGIAAKDLDKAAYVTFCYNDGTADHCGGVLGYTIGLYCKSQASKTGTLADLAKACAVYGYYAKQLFS